MNSIGLHFLLFLHLLRIAIISALCFLSTIFNTILYLNYLRGFYIPHYDVGVGGYKLKLTLFYLNMHIMSIGCTQIISTLATPTPLLPKRTDRENMLQETSCVLRVV